MICFCEKKRAIIGDWYLFGKPELVHSTVTSVLSRLKGSVSFPFSTLSLLAIVKMNCNVS